MAARRRARPEVLDFTPKYNGDDEQEVKPKLWKAKQLNRSKRKQWLALNRIPRSGVTVLVGDEGIGKSLFWVWIVAAVTTGKPLSEFGIPARDPQHVRLVLTEDDWSSEVRPRLIKAGADLDYVTVIACYKDGSGAPVFPRDMDLVYQAPVPALIVVDGWLDTLPATIDIQRPQSAARALTPWRNAAIQLDAAVILVTHTNRTNAAKTRDKYGGTGELRKKARMTLFAQRDAQKRLLVGPEKTNGASILASAIFTIKSVKAREPTDDDDGTVPVLEYVEDSDQTASEHSEEKEPEAQWLFEFLNDGPKERTEVFDAAKAKGFKTYRIYEVATKLKVDKERKDFGGPTIWSLPD